MRVRKDVAEVLGLLSRADTVADVLLDAPGDLCDAGINVGDEGAQGPRNVLNLLRGRRDDILERPVERANPAPVKSVPEPGCHTSRQGPQFSGARRRRTVSGRIARSRGALVLKDPAAQERAGDEGKKGRSCRTGSDARRRRGR